MTGRPDPVDETDGTRWELHGRHRLVATMAAVPGVGIVHLPAHLRRLAASARAANIPVDTDRWAYAATAALGRWLAGRAASGGAALRLLVGRGGGAVVECRPLASWDGRPVCLAIDDQPIDEADPRWRHKTTDRAPYDDRRRRQPEADDVVLVNRQRQVTETTRANLLVRIDGRWWTPPESSGCLPGAGRAVLLERGVIEERTVAVAELMGAEAVAVVSSLRGWRPATVQLRAMARTGRPARA